MGLKAVVGGIGDSLWAGFNSGPPDVKPTYGEEGSEKVTVFNRWTNTDLLVRLGLSSTGHTPGWDPLTFSESNYQYDGPAPMYFLANHLVRLLGLEELRVVMLGVPATDAVQSPPGGNNGVSWYPNLSGGIMNRFETEFVQEALATPEVTSDHVYLGTFASLGNNRNSINYTTDESASTQAQLNAVFTEVESFFLASGAARQVCTRIPLSVFEASRDFVRTRMLESRRQMTAWTGEATSSLPRAYASLDDIPFNLADPHYPASSLEVMALRMLYAFRCAQGDFPNVNVV